MDQPDRPQFPEDIVDEMWLEDYHREIDLYEFFGAGKMMVSIELSCPENFRGNYRVTPPFTSKFIVKYIERNVVRCRYPTQYPGLIGRLRYGNCAVIRQGDQQYFVNRTCIPIASKN